MVDTLELRLAIIVLSLATACAHAGKVAPTLQISADACEALAVEWGQPDVAEVCRKGGDLAPVLDMLLRARAQTRKACSGPDCPDGGAQ